MKHGVIKPEPHVELDRIYEKHKPLLPDKESAENEKLLLSNKSVPEIVSILKLSTSVEADLIRALDQTESRLTKQTV